MHGFLFSAGECLEIDCDLRWVASLIEEAASGELKRVSAGGASAIRIRIEADRRPFDVGGWEPLTRGVWARDGEVVMEDPCTAGFDLHVRSGDGRSSFTFRWRPPARSRVAGWLLRSRFHLLARAVLLQYPAIWCAGTRGRVPLHATSVSAGSSIPLLAGPGGVGKSTLIARELAHGGEAIGDNLCVVDGSTAWGVIEPIRLEGASGRKMPHGRREATMPGRVASLVPDRVVVVRRGCKGAPFIRQCDGHTATRSLVTGTYMAGELRRYWAFASTLAAGTGVGPAHPPVADVAATLTDRLPCFEVGLARTTTGARLAELLEPLEAGAWS